MEQIGDGERSRLCSGFHMVEALSPKCGYRFFYDTQSNERHRKINIIQKYNNVRMLNQLSKNYDRLIIRYPLWDPFLQVMLRRKQKFITEHHTKGSELKLIEIYYYTESIFGARFLRRCYGVVAVTKEILDYEARRVKQPGFQYFLPNSISPTIDNVLSNTLGLNDVINVVMAANFRVWHGLTRLLSRLNSVMQSIYMLLVPVSQ